MNILLLTTDFGYGGAERSFAKLSHQLAQHHKVSCVFFNDREQQVYPVAGDVHFLDSDTTSSLSFFRFLSRSRQLSKLKRQLNTHVTISFLEGADYVSLMAGGGIKVASIRGSKQHDAEISGWRGKLRRLAMKVIYKRFSRVVCVAEALRQEMRDYCGVLPEKLVCIENGYNFQASIPTSPTFSDVAKTIAAHKSIVCVGRLHQQKNQKQLIQSFRQVIEHEPNAKLVLIGEGPDINELVNCCQKLQLSHTQAPKNDSRIDTAANVWFLGYRQDAAFLCQAATLNVLPSLWEGFPNALIEAIISGPPVLASDCPTGPAEIMLSDTSHYSLPVESEFGMLMPMLKPETDEIWSQLMTRWLAVPPELLSRQKAVERLQRKYNENAIAERWINLLIELEGIKP